ncbi:MAG: hypothetical protein M3Z33_12090 [Actinomycetota bacterium]|nr:hypothetical protein [Actinomycetota bacterium]
MSLRALGLPALVAGLMAASGCGGSSEQQKVRSTLTRYEQASARQDYAQLCDKVLSRALVARLSRVGLPCQQALRMGLGSVQAPKLEILKVKVMGPRALALVRSSAVGQQASTDTIELVLDGSDWRLSALARPGPEPPQRTRPPGD